MSTPYKVIVMTQEDWVAFRWQIALDVIVNISDIDAARHAVSVLRDADAKAQVEWRGGEPSTPATP